MAPSHPAGHRSSAGPEDGPQHPARALLTPVACGSKGLQFWLRETGSQQRRHGASSRPGPVQSVGTSGPLRLCSDQVAPRPRCRAGSGAGLPTLGGTWRGRTPLCLAGQCVDHPHRDQWGWGDCGCGHPCNPTKYGSLGLCLHCSIHPQPWLMHKQEANWVCPQGQGTPRTPPTSGRMFGVEFSMTHKSAGRLWQLCWPPAHVQQPVLFLLQA